MFFTIFLVILIFVAALYVALSIPAVQDSIKKRAESELTNFLGGKVQISDLDIMPFNEVRLFGVSVYDPKGERCLSVGRLGAGIGLWTLITTGTVEINYVELISLNAHIAQQHKDSPLNIDFIIKALSPKNDGRPPAAFKVRIRNIVIRKSSATFDRQFIPALADLTRIDFNHIEVSNLRADIALPLLMNDNFTVDLRRLAFDEKSGLSVKNISAFSHITPDSISVSDFKIALEDSKLTVSDQKLRINGFGSIADALKTSHHSVRIEASPLVLAEFSSFFPPLAGFTDHTSLVVDASGTAESFEVEELKFEDRSRSTLLGMTASVKNLLHPKSLSATIHKLDLTASQGFIASVSSALSNNASGLLSQAEAIGNVKLAASGSFDNLNKKADLLADISCGVGDLAADAAVKWRDKQNLVAKLSAKAEDIDLSILLPQSGLGKSSFSASGNLSMHGGIPNGEAELELPYIAYNSGKLENISIKGHKAGKEISAVLSVDCEAALIKGEASCSLAGTLPSMSMQTVVGHFTPRLAGIASAAKGSFSGEFSAELNGNSPDNLTGSASLKDFYYRDGNEIHLDHVDLNAAIADGIRHYSLSSDVIEGNIEGSFAPTQLVSFVRSLLSQAVPFAISPSSQSRNFSDVFAQYNFRINPDEHLFEAVKIPVRPATAIELGGRVDGSSGTCALDVSAPYLIQGRDKLIKDFKISSVLADSTQARVNIAGEFPLKNDIAKLNITTSAFQNNIDASIGWTMKADPQNKGELLMGVDIYRNPLDRGLCLSAEMKPSEFVLNGSSWSISPASIHYAPHNLKVENLRISNNAQFIDINGSATDSPLDILSVELAGIDLKYIFDILNINYVDFGGIATGKAHVSDIFSKMPIATTDNLFVKDLAYNDCVLGDGLLESHWDNDWKMVAINADISAPRDTWAKVRGGVYVTRDSLSFDFDANRINVELLKPFVSGFTSSIKGRATGKLKLFGTFSDIDLVGKAYADSVSMYVDYTNVTYTGSDTIYFNPGRISIPSMRLFDKYGNSGILRGEVRHSYLHDAKFNFNITDVKRMLVYDTDARINPLWYGHIFANGSASITGVPGFVGISVNAATADNSQFTFVLDENETAENYTFLSFSDKRKESRDSVVIEETIEEKLRKKVEEQIMEIPDLFNLDLALDVRPGATMVIVMDPKAGDKIKANGNGALQLHYDSDTGDINMYGKYTLSKGTYNFSLQELILKNFNIEEGSSISFNGDPLRGMLDIIASYRVNTNLADLDESFKSDPDLNRTTVPVDALLKVTGEIDAPEINFDLDLPTVTGDVERKVRSIISTEDMMNRQVIYLLALNRFYTPDYTSAERGGELASVASSTISSQIQNIVGSLTDKFSLAPSFKSEKDDFSDMEVDVALSSRLFDDRLLINGNVGYRDRTTSQTTFIGDFDIEYLLSRDGKLRLKAYNHFNDASYYLKSALTTQGIGIVYRKEFDDPLSFIKRLLRRKKNDDNKRQGEITDKKQKQ